MRILFSTNLRLLREATGFTQRELAEKLGTSQRKISYWENGAVQPDLENLWSIADLFDVTTDELIGRKKY